MCSSDLLLLGVGSYLARFSSIWIPGEQTTMLLLPVAHRLVASLILGAAVVLALRVAMTRAGPATAGDRFANLVTLQRAS